jgi:GntR family transcriptional regulator
MNQTLDFNPLHAQVRQLMIQRLVAGVWRPGTILPSESDLASEFGVSPGTVSKALDTMAGDNLVVRRQGKGTFVAEHDPDRDLFHFFQIVGEDEGRVLPESEILDLGRAKATAATARRLGVETGSAVIRFRHLRRLGGRPVMVETITVPEALFPGLDPTTDDTLYVVYERQFGITIVRADERLRAGAATDDEARLLGVRPASPLIEIERSAYTFNDKPVELRVSRCDTRHHHYLSKLD